jgi:hypothetical protein
MRYTFGSIPRLAGIVLLALSVAKAAQAQATVTLSNTVNSGRNPGGTNIVCSANAVDTNVAATTPLETMCETSFLSSRSVARGSFVGSILSLGTFSTLTSLTDYFTTHESSRAQATFRDTVTPTWTGFARFSWQVQGTASCSPNCTPFGVYPSAGVGLSVNGIRFSWGPDGVPAGAFGPSVVTFDVPVVADVPVDLTVTMHATAWVENTRADYRATSDFLNGATLLSVALLDSNQEPVAGAALVSNAGLSYPTSAPTPGEQIESLIGAIGDLLAVGGLKSGQDTGLTRPLENALRSLSSGRIASACSQLYDFEGEVTQKVLDGALASEDGEALIEAARSIRANLGC